MQDYSAVPIELLIDTSIAGHNQLLRNPEALASARKEYDTHQTGPLAIFGASEAVLFARLPELYASSEFQSLSSESQTHLSNSSRPSTEIWFHSGPIFYRDPLDDDDRVLATVGLCQNNLSKGSVRLESSDPRRYPLIDPGYCTEPYDWRIAIETVKLQLRIFKTPALQLIIRKPLLGPGNLDAAGNLTLCAQDDEEAIRTFLAETLDHGYHAMSTCVMGGEENKERVVDPQFRVVGLEGLRVADMSVCPILTNNHTQINAYLIAERCAQSILGENDEH